MEGEIIPGAMVETERVKPSVLLMCGAHGINEEVAKRVAMRLDQHTAGGLNLVVQSYPEGLDYIDAYEETKEEVPNIKSVDFYRRYNENVGIRVAEKNKIFHQVAGEYPNSLVIDVHATPLTEYQQDRFREGLDIHVGLDEDQKNRLQQELAERFPVLFTATEDFCFNISQGSSKEIVSGEVQDYPRNSIVIELLMPYDEIYRNLAEEEEPSVSEWSGANELHVLKETDNLDRAAKIELIGKVNHQVTKFARLLDVVLPAIASFYQNNGVIS